MKQNKRKRKGKGKKSPDFADFSSVNTVMMANFKLPKI